MTAELIGSDQTFTQQERQVLAAIATATIGEDQARGLPSAGDSEVMPIVLRKAEHFAARLKPGIELLQTELDPLAVSAAELLEQLNANSRLQRFFRIFTIVVLQSYYQSPKVLRALNLADRPPFPQGHEVQTGDWSLLDSVKTRKPFYRPV